MLQIERDELVNLESLQLMNLKGFGVGHAVRRAAFGGERDDHEGRHSGARVPFINPIASYVESSHLALI